jgi:5-formyltetrahydrofolate cyclo-ligase
MQGSLGMYETLKDAIPFTITARHLTIFMVVGSSMSPDSESLTSQAEGKEVIRRQIWTRLEAANVARPPFPVRGRIPNYAGAVHAAKRLEQLPQFDDWRLVFCNPDSPQRPVRHRFLETGKRVVMATPKLRSGFLLLDPKNIPASLYSKAATIRGAFDLGQLVEKPPDPVDVKIMGSVAVDEWGGRIGKGGGYSDLEFGILAELNLITPETPTVTTVHDLQISPDQLVMTRTDIPVDIVVTPTRHFQTHTSYPRPKGIDWSIISPKRVKKIAWPPELSVPCFDEEDST